MALNNPLKIRKRGQPSCLIIKASLEPVKLFPLVGVWLNPLRSGYAAAIIAWEALLDSAACSQGDLPGQIRSAKTAAPDAAPY